MLVGVGQRLVRGILTMQLGGSSEVARSPYNLGLPHTV